MIDLERIQMQRADEQADAFDFHERPPKLDGRRFNCGPRLTDKLCELGCGTRLAITNKRGVCSKCADRQWRRFQRKDPRSVVAKRKDRFTHGGGI